MRFLDLFRQSLQAQTRRQPKTWNCAPDRKSSMRCSPFWSEDWKGAPYKSERVREIPFVFFICSLSYASPRAALQRWCGKGHGGCASTYNSGWKPLSMTKGTVPKVWGNSLLLFSSFQPPRTWPPWQSSWGIGCVRQRQKLKPRFLPRGPRRGWERLGAEKCQGDHGKGGGLKKMIT